MKRILFIAILFIIVSRSWSQELYCSVQVNTRQVQGTEKKVFETMQNAIFEFLNNRKWSSYNFKIEERIECSNLITISERISSEEFKGNLNIALRRPAFNSSYNSIVLNLVDNDLQFRYVENQPLDYSENSYTSELTSILAYYVYIFLGLDFDTYTLYGGTPFYEKAEAVVSTAQNAPYPGWKAYESVKNRYWIIENLLNPAYQPLRKFLYEYHRKGLDAMYENPDGGRAAVTKSLEYLNEVYQERPGLFILQVIIDSKRSEFMSIYSEGSSTEKNKAVNIFREIDPAHSSDYQEILNK